MINETCRTRDPWWKTITEIDSLKFLLPLRRKTEDWEHLLLGYAFETAGCTTEPNKSLGLQPQLKSISAFPVDISKSPIYHRNLHLQTIGICQSSFSTAVFCTFLVQRCIQTSGFTIQRKSHPTRDLGTRKINSMYGALFN